VLPLDARRFRVEDQELAATLAVAGGELVTTEPDVEVVGARKLRGDARCAVVVDRASIPESPVRALRAARRLGGAARVRTRAAHARRVLSGLGYEQIYSLAWDRGTSVHRRGTRSDAARLAHRFPLNEVTVGQHVSAETPFAAAMQGAERLLGRPFREESLLLAASGVVVAPGAEAVVRAALGPSTDRITDQLDALAALHACNPPAEIADRVPRTLGRGIAGLATWSVETRLPGRRAPSVISSELEQTCIEFLVRLFRLSDEGAPRRLVADAADVVAGVASEEWRGAIRSLGRELDESLGDVPCGFGHGDFWSGNLLVMGDQLTGVVDWPSATPGSLPLLDLLQLKSIAKQEASGRSIGTVILEDLADEFRSGGCGLVREYARRIDLDLRPALLLDLLKAYWLAAIAREVTDPDRDPGQALSARWRELNVDRVAQTFAGTRRPPGGARAAGAWDTAEARVDVATEMEQLDAVEHEWSALAEARENPFVSPEWFRAWSFAMDGRARPYVPVVRHADGSVLGLLPLVLTGPSRLRSLAFAGAAFGDYFHPVAAEGPDELETARRAAAALNERRDEWAILVADYAAERAGWIDELATTAGMPLTVTGYHEHASVYRSVRLAGLTWEGYLATRSANLRSQLARKERSLERAGEVSYRLVDAATLPAAMQTLFDLHGRRWEGRNTTVFSTDTARRFHLEFANAALARGWLRLWLLEVDGSAIAAWYGWRLGSRYLYYQAGFDPEWSQYSPGLLLLARSIRGAFEEGAATYDMLLGDEAYKSRFAEVERTARTVVLTRRGHPAGALVAAEMGVRSVMHRLPTGRSGSAVRALLEPLRRRWPIVTAP
jgi:CelD/BcsL family acetyltransferase involved in cellulose biosynthesis